MKRLKWFLLTDDIHDSAVFIKIEKRVVGTKRIWNDSDPQVCPYWETVNTYDDLFLYEVPNEP